jgi:ornithine--oxo-acid transaminase
MTTEIVDYADLEETWTAHNYAPLPVVISHAEGVWLTDITGRRYIDILAAYSALNFGHRHPDLVAAAVEQLGRVTLTSRAFRHDQLALFCQELADLTGTEMVLPMNAGAEAVESAIKVARKWAYRVKGVPAGKAQIVVADANFHGRTTTIVSFSTDPSAREGFGPYTPGFVHVKFDDIDALASAITPHTAAVLIEPIQGEAGVVVPTPGYLRAVRRLCDENNVLLIADEIQSGLGRTGEILACDHESVRADLSVLGKALGGGIFPVSAVVGRRDVLGVLRPGEHGSTFGGNPVACAVGRAVVRLLHTETCQRNARELGAYLHARLQALVGNGAASVSGMGLWASIRLAPGGLTAHDVSEALADRGVLHKELGPDQVRVAPPLTITREELDIAIAAITDVITR